VTAEQKIRPALSENHQQQVDVAIATATKKSGIEHSPLPSFATATPQSD
jgi:hypothetical protein